MIPRPAAEAAPYAVPRARAPIDLPLDANEGAPPPGPWLEEALTAETIRRYPNTRALEARIAGTLGLEPDQVLVTAGADDALDRCCRAVLGTGDEAIFPEPGFAVMRRWIGLTGAAIRSVAWPDGPWPLAEVVAQTGAKTKMIVLTSPNNPTGGVATPADLRAASAAAPGALVVADLAYAEFADEDLTPTGLDLPNVVVVRSLSKAWGLAGLRVGFAAGPARIIGWLRACGLPYPVSAPALQVAARAWEDPNPMARIVARVRRERALTTTYLRDRGVTVQDSQANFVLCRVADPVGWRDDLAGLGVGIRAFPGVPDLQDAVRIGMPADEANFSRLIGALETTLRPAGLWVEDRRLGLPGLPTLPDLRSGAWARCRTNTGIRAARAAGALPLVDDPNLEVHGAAPWGLETARRARLTWRSP